MAHSSNDQKFLFAAILCAVVAWFFSSISRKLLGASTMVTIVFNDAEYAPIQAWRNDQFPTTIISGDAENLADPDHDGIPILLEYAFGTSPVKPNPSQNLALSIVEVDGNKHLYFHGSKNPEAIELNYIAEFSDDMISWTSDGDVLIDTTTQLQVRSPLNSGQKFARLRV
jgi:hypothetical protein